MAIDPHGLLAAALSVRVTADTTGLDAEVASKLTAAERRAIQTSERVSRAAGRIAEVGAATSAKLEASTLRQTAAQESYNRLLRAGETDTVRLARAQASLITAQAGVRREQARLTEATAATSRAGEAATVGALGGTRQLVGLAAGAGLFTALRRGVGDYERLTGSVRQYQRVTGQTAEDSSRMVAILDRFGLSGERATQAMLRFGRNIAEQPQKLRQFGVEIAHNTDGTVNLSKSLLNANDAFHRTPDATKRASLALSLFGRGGQSLLPILAANRDTLKGFMDEAQRSGVVFSQADLTRARDLAMAQKSLTESWQGFEILLARGVTPALRDVDRIGTGVMNLFTSHQTVGKAVVHLGELAGAAFLVSKGMKAMESARSSTLLTKLFNVRETDAQTAANGRLAASQLAVARTAGVEAAALGGVDVAATAGAGAGVLGSMAALRATVPGAARIGVPAVGTLALGGPIAAVGALALVAASAPSQGPIHRTSDGVLRTADGKPVLMGRFGSGGQDYSRQHNLDLINDPGSFHPDPIAVARQQQQEQLQEHINQQARASLAATGRQYAAGIDIFSRAPSLTPRADPQAAQALASAQTRAADAARRVTLDQQKLNALRATGKASTLQIAAAEETYRLAKERSAKASQDVQDAEKKAHAERLPTARGLLATATSQANRAAQDAKAVERLYAVGLGPQVVAKIIAQNANQPGALESVARTETPKLAAALQREFRRTQIDGSVIAGTPDQWRKAGDERALDFLAGVQNRFNQAAAPVIAARIAGVRRRTDSQEPVTSRTRQRSLSGSPSLPHGA